MRTRLTAALAALLMSCSQPSETRAPVPADLKIFVELDGHSLPAIDAAALSAEPDLEDEHRIAWRLERFVPQIARASQLVVEKRDGERVVLPLGGEDGEDGQTAAGIALLLNRKGEVVLGSLDADNPFPAFHGRGGNRGRGQQGEERIRDPHWLRLRSRAAERPAGAGSR